jgi:hypothetical protein
MQLDRTLVLQSVVATDSLAVEDAGAPDAGRLQLAGLVTEDGPSVFSFVMCR